MKWLLLVLACACTRPPEATPQGESIIIGLPARGVATRFFRVGQVGDVTTWQSRDGLQVSLRHGVLVATRGFGHDLHLMEPDNTLRAIIGGAAVYARDLVHVDGVFDQQVLHVDCRIIAPTRTSEQRLFTESCSGDADFENQYLVDAYGAVLWARQWISHEVGTMEITRID